MTVYIDASEVKELAVDLAAAPARMEAQGGHAVRATLHDIDASARDLAAVRTGEMRARVHTVMEGALAGAVTDDSDHAAYNEYGTSKMEAQPFMGPAFELNEARLDDRLGDAGQDAIL